MAEDVVLIAILPTIVDITVGVWICLHFFYCVKLSIWMFIKFCVLFIVRFYGSRENFFSFDFWFDRKRI